MTVRNKIEHVKCLWHRRKVSSTYKLFNYYLLNVKMLFLAVNEFAGSVTVEIVKDIFKLSIAFINFWCN